MLGTPSQMNDYREDEEVTSLTRQEIHETALLDLEREGKAIFDGRNGEETIEAVEVIDDCFDDELIAVLATFWQKRRKGTYMEVLTATNKVFEKLDRMINEILEDQL